MQIPPKYSAKNVNGRRGYDLARAGIEFELAPKKVRIYSIDLLGKKEDTEDTYLFKIRCGGGTYIRSIARDMAAALGTKAVMSGLRRTQSGIFTLQNAIPFEVLEKDPSVEELEKYLIPTDSVLPFETLALTEVEMGRILQGQRVKTNKADGIYKIYTADGFYGLAEVLDGLAKAKTKLC
jgi:tRNA pseudouridine55 synthase